MKWWLSFAGDEGWRGAVIVEAPSFLMAVSETNYRKCNPLGEVRGFEIPGDVEIDPKWMNRLLSLEDVKAFDLASGGKGNAINPDTGAVK